MLKTAGALQSVAGLEDLAAGDSPVHRLDPRVKVLATAAYAVALASFGRHEISALLPFALYPVTLAALGGIPARPILVRTALALPFVLLLGAFNPLLEREPRIILGGIAVGAGWLSLASLLLRSLLGCAAALLLLATTGFFSVARALQSLGLPRAFVQQLLMLHRYLFLVGEEAQTMERARSLRAFGRPLDLRTFGALAGSLLLRAFQRARRIHAAMLCRGYQGLLPLEPARTLGAAEWLFLAGSLGGFLALRLWNLPQLMGALMTGTHP